MARSNRNFRPGLYYHVIHRGVRKQTIFFKQSDAIFYLHLLRQLCNEESVELVAFCLMTNHLHLLLRPNSQHGISRLLKRLNGAYAARLRKRYGLTGHAFESKPFITEFDHSDFDVAKYYIEYNPVEAGIVKDLKRYLWSSANERWKDLISQKIMVNCSE